jgi:hypothetical protein
MRHVGSILLVYPHLGGTKEHLFQEGSLLSTSYVVGMFIKKWHERKEKQEACPNEVRQNQIRMVKCYR